MGLAHLWNNCVDPRAPGLCPGTFKGRGQWEGKDSGKEQDEWPKS